MGIVYGEEPIILLGDTDAGKTTLRDLLYGESVKEKPPATSAIDSEGDRRLGGRSDWSFSGLFGDTKLRTFDCPGNPDTRKTLERQLAEYIASDIFDGKFLNVFYCVDGTKLFGSADNRRNIQCRVRADMDMVVRLFKQKDLDLGKRRFFIVVTRHDRQTVKEMSINDVQTALGPMVTNCFHDVGASDRTVLLVDLKTDEGRKLAFRKIGKYF